MALDFTEIEKLYLYLEWYNVHTSIDIVRLKIKGHGIYNIFELVLRRTNLINPMHLVLMC